MESWDILDRYGNKTGSSIQRGEELKDDQYHLVVHIWIINEYDEFLIQKRAEHLDFFPGIWATTGGSAVQGEDSKAAAIRETKEELGIDPDPNKIDKIKRIQRKDNFTDIWILKQDISSHDIDLSNDEVSEVKSVNRSELIDMIESGDFYDYGEEYFDQIFELLR